MPTETKALRVLVVRLSAMGDILHALPAITALRLAHPNWILGWVVEPHWAALLSATSHDGSGQSVPPASPQKRQGLSAFEGLDASERGASMPVVDRVHLAGAKSWGRRPLRAATWKDIARVRTELSEQCYDVCLDLQGAVRSAVIGRWAGASRMIGEDSPRERAARWLFTERVATRGRHVIEQCLEVAEAIAGEPLGYVSPQLPRGPLGEAWAEHWLAQNSLDRFVILNPGAGWGAKRWPAERYGKVAAALHRAGYGVIVNAAPAEVELASAVVAASAGVAIAATPALGELIALTRRAALVIAGDTGPLHLANALTRPVVAIFGPTDPERNGPFRSEFRVLRHAESRRDHSRRPEPEAGLLTISAETVLEAAMELLGKKASDSGSDSPVAGTTLSGEGALDGPSYFAREARKRQGAVDHDPKGEAN